MDFLVINPRFCWFGNQSILSTGPLTLVSYLAQDGALVRLLDDNSQYRKYSEFDFVQYIRQHDPTVIGISTNTLNVLAAYNLTNALRRNFPTKAIVGGGLHSYDSAEEMAEQPFDLVFRGEAELSAKSFLQLVRDHGAGFTRETLADPGVRSKLKTIPGLVFRDGSKLEDTGPAVFVDNLDEVPFLDYQLANLDDYIRSPFDHHAVTNNFNFQRGCPHRCIYCKSSIIPSKVRSNSAEFMVREIESRQRQYGLSNLFILDANFTLDRRRMNDFCARMTTSGLAQKVNIMVQSSVTAPINDEELTSLRRAGITIISLGLERFDDEFRRKMNKAGSSEHAVALIQRLHSARFKVVINVLIGFPFETEDSLDREAAFLDKYLEYVDFFTINYLMPMPGTQVYDASPASRHHRWYLRPEIAERPMAYYDAVYLTSGPVLFLNPFGLSRRILTKLRRFKDKYHRIGARRLSRAPVYRIALAGDFLLAQFSYWLAALSPQVESVVFKPFKYLRSKGYKLFFRRFVAQGK